MLLARTTPSHLPQAVHKVHGAHARGVTKKKKVKINKKALSSWASDKNDKQVGGVGLPFYRL